ncbi:hypothetical protein D1646_07505 [Pseudoflavonifractor sp. 60]|uniref:DUF6672 family protein n=1 Tax=Pseudoflavonifractor sp. 60 TaxID=2304576 RepID=UPI001371D9DB|nr:DUF6672 family protein [Pseudoflavonifractor sp. 60]NBI66665.1 hypothetical protein [Pseudoflavonifractor sp. 60]
MKSRQIVFSLLLVAVLVAIAGCMLVIGRGHTVYFDNKTLEGYQGQDYKAFERVVVKVKGEEVAKLGKRERGMSIWIGQNFQMTLEITENKGDEPVVKEVSIKLPYSVDGIVVNLPAYLAGLPEEAWYTEFVPAVTKEPVEEDPTIGDDFGLGDELGLEGDGL